jgi:hypothetical protein
MSLEDLLRGLPPWFDQAVDQLLHESEGLVGILPGGERIPPAPFGCGPAEDDGADERYEGDGLPDGDVAAQQGLDEGLADDSVGKGLAVVPEQEGEQLGMMPACGTAIDPSSAVSFWSGVRGRAPRTISSSSIAAR